MTLRAAKSLRSTAGNARTFLPALVAAALIALVGSSLPAADPAQPSEVNGPLLPGGPQPSEPEIFAPSTPPATQAPRRDVRSFEPAPIPTPDNLGLPPAAPPAVSTPAFTGPPVSAPPTITAPAVAAPMATYVPCEDEFWIASSWGCRQTAPHGCACGDLDFYHVSSTTGSQQLNRQAFGASLTPGAPVCVVVHGSFTNWKGLCDDCAPVLRWIRSAAPQRPLNVLFYTWPSRGGITYEPHVDVAILGTRASFNSIYLAELVARIPPGHPVCLIGHSHGARMVAAALHALGGGDVDGVRLTWPAPPDLRLRGVFIAGALDHHWLDPGQRFDMALCRTESLLVLRNDHDIVLTFYPLRKLFSKRAIGERGLSNRDVRRLGWQSSKVCVLDVTQLVQSGHVWSHYYSCPQIAGAIAPYVYYDNGQPMAAVTVPPAPAVSETLSLDRSPN